MRSQIPVSPHPAPVRKDASPGRGNEPCNTSDRNAGNTAERCGRRVHRQARLPDRVVLWVLLLSRSWHPPRHERQCRREGAQRARSTTPTLFTPLQAIYTRPSEVARHISHRATARRYVGTRKLFTSCGIPASGGPTYIHSSPHVTLITFSGLLRVFPRFAGLLSRARVVQWQCRSFLNSL